MTHEFPIQPAPVLPQFTAASVQAAIDEERRKIALPSAPEPSQRLSNKIQKETLPFDRSQFAYGGSLAYIPNPDPILRYLTRNGEKEWRDMERVDSTVSGEMLKRKRRLLKAGTELVSAGDKPSQKTLFEIALRALKSIEDSTAVSSLALDARPWGWRPMQVIYGPPTNFAGRRMQFPIRVLDHYPEKFAFTEDRELVLLEEWGKERKLTSVADQFMWLTPKSGSTSNPYGVGLYRQGVWIAYYMRQRYLEYMTAGTQRSTGIPRVRQSALGQGEHSAGAVVTAKSTEELIVEMREVMAVLGAEGFLIERAGVVIDFVENMATATDSWLKTIEYWDKLIRILINGGTLTSDIGSVGSKAATSEHGEEADSNAIADAKEVLEPFWGSLLAKVFKYNVGEVDPDDVPKLRSKLSTRSSIDAAKTLFDMGAALDGKRIAQDAGVPLDPKQPDQVLEKQAAPTIGVQGQLPFGGGKPGDQEQPKKPAKKGAN